MSRGRQKWQIFAIDETYYVLRSKEGRVDAFLGTMYSEDETTPGNTSVRMVRGNVSDDSVFWQISLWGDGTFHMTNKRNGTEWNLTRKIPGNGLVAMSNTTSRPVGQQWSFEPIAEIQNDVFSTVNVSTGPRQAREGV
jgi:hypothetical protein